MPTLSTLSVDVVTNTSRFSKGLKIAVGGLAALATGAALAFKEFEDAEKVTRQTAAVLESTGGVANVTAQHVRSLADAISQKVGVDDEAIASGENLLLTFTKIRNEAGAGNDIFNQATHTIVDMSAALGQDLKSSAIQVGKALNDPVLGMTALRRVGVSFTDWQVHAVQQMVKHNDLLGAQKFILEELTKEFAGSAEAQATSSAKMGVAFGNLMETVGGLIAPLAEKLLGALTKVAMFLQENVGPAVQALGQWFTEMWGKVQPAVQGIVEWFQKIWDAVKPVAETVGKELVEAFTQTWRVLQSNLGPMLAALWSLLQKLWDVFKPLVIVIGVQLYLAFRVITEVLPVAIALITKLIEWLAKIIEGALAVVTFIRDKFVEPIINFLGRIVQWISDHWRGAWEVMKVAVGAVVGPIIAFIDRIIGVVKTLVGWIQTAIGFFRDLITLSGEAAPAGSFKGQVPSRFGIPPNAVGQSGGAVERTGWAFIHAGETLVPAGADGGGGDIIFQIDGQTFARIARDQLLKLKEGRVSLGLS